MKKVLLVLTLLAACAAIAQSPQSIAFIWSSVAGWMRLGPEFIIDTSTSPATLRAPAAIPGPAGATGPQGPAITGQPCAVAAGGAPTLMVKLADGSCLPIIVVSPVINTAADGSPEPSGEKTAWAVRSTSIIRARIKIIAQEIRNWRMKAARSRRVASRWASMS